MADRRFDIGTDPAGWLADLQVALGFLTRLPVGAAGSLGNAAWTFPVVGLIVGAVAALVFAIAHALSLPHEIGAILAVAAAIALTGALHEDGLADTADGFGGGVERWQRLAIMRDSRIGSYGMIALILALLLRVAALAALPGPGRVAAALIAAHVLSRAALVPVLRHEPLARDDGLAAGAGRPPAGVSNVALALAAILALLFLGISTAIAAGLVVTATTLGLAWLARRQIGGQTGDVLGAMQQIGEIGVLLALLAVG
jgi:adenosylcobinamide-GDP ribazoletransferase